MAQSDRIFRWAFVALFGIGVAGALGVMAGLLWMPLGWIVFIVGTLCWFGLTIDGMLRQRRFDPSDLVAENLSWHKEDLPEEFRFIDHSTTVQEILDKVGPYKRVRGDGEIRALEYHLPYGSALLVFPEIPVAGSSKIRAMKFYCDRNEVPLFD